MGTRQEMTDPEIDALEALLGDPLAGVSEPPDARLKTWLLDLAGLPELPIDTSRYQWSEPVPGVKLAVLAERPERGLRACLAWGRAGARMPRHRHGGDELIYVLEGVLRDERASYGPGGLCRSRTGDVHSEEVVEDCLCYVLYYGELEFLE